MPAQFVQSVLNSGSPHNVLHGTTHSIYSLTTLNPRVHTKSTSVVENHALCTISHEYQRALSAITCVMVIGNNNVGWSVVRAHVQYMAVGWAWVRLQTAQTELAFTELCWSISAPYYRCLDHVLAVACPLSIHQSHMSALLLLGPTADAKNHTRCMPCDDLCTCSVSDCLIHNVWSTCGKILSNQ